MTGIRRRIAVPLGLFTCLILIQALQFFRCQIVMGPELAQMASTMRTRGDSVPETARGPILDRNYIPLTGISNSWACFIMADVISNPRMVAAKISDLVDMDPWMIEDRIYLAKERKQAVTLIKYPLQKHSLNNRKLPPGVIIVPVKQRYREDGFLIHLLGHVGQSLEKPVLQGDAGLEKRYDSTLKGKQAQEVVAVVNGMGQPIAGLTPKSKDDSETVEYAVVTTIDKRTQAIVEKVMDQRVTSGAVVVMNIKNRDILAMASRPTYNPYNPASYQGNTESAWLLNRALTPFYPGSVFKIVVAAAALENHAIDSTAEFYCPGSYRYSSRLTIPCWKQNGHGKVNLEQALAESCNVAFIEMGLKVGRTRLLELCRRVHLAEQEIIGYSDTQSGSHVAIDYGRPALGNATLGQQGVYLTPVQISNLIATLASNGVYKRPRLVIQTWGKGNTRIYYPPDRGEKVLNQAVCNELCRYLCQVTAYGTGKNADLPGVGCGGKTATSQTGHYTSAGEEVLNTWFTGFFPADNPQWVVTVLVEHGQSGGYNAAPVFKEIAEGILEQSAQYEPTLKEKGNKNNLANDL